LDCVFGSSENGLNNIPIKLIDTSGSVVFSTNSFENGFYMLGSDSGTYTVFIDTLNLPLQPSCINPGVDSIIVLTQSNSLVQMVDFGLKCKPGFDLGVQSVVVNSWVFPGQNHELLKN
jgi:hypothetical protein